MYNRNGNAESVHDSFGSGLGSVSFTAHQTKVVLTIRRAVIVA